MNRSFESSETQPVLFRSVNHRSRCSRPGDSLLSASVSAQARLPSPEHHVTAKKHTRNVRISSWCAITRGAFLFVSLRIFWACQRGLGWTRTGFPRDGFCGVRHHYSRSCAFWACRTTGCRSPALFFYEGPHNIFAPYLRMRSVAPLVDAHSLSMGSKLEFYWHEHVDVVRKNSLGI